MPWNEKNEFIEAYKQSKRREDDIAIVTSAIYVKLDQSICYCQIINTNVF